MSLFSRGVISAVLALLLFANPAGAEKLEDRFVVKTVSAGQLYFICPYEVPSLQKQPAAECDITYLLGSDSLTFNFSVFLPEAITADSISIGSDRRTITDFETFYINSKKKEVRTSLQFPAAISILLLTV